MNYSPGILTPCKRNICSIGSDIFIFRDCLPLILKVSQTVMYDVVVYMKNGLPLACDSSLEKSNNSYAFSQCSLIQWFISVFCITHWSCFLAGLSSHTRFSQLITLLMYLPLENLAFIIRRDWPIIIELVFFVSFLLGFLTDVSSSALLNLILYPNPTLCSVGL